jgi:hypothetical protein
MTEEIEFILDSTKESMTGCAFRKRIFKYSCRKSIMQCLEAFLLIITDQQHHFLKYRKLAFLMREQLRYSLEKNMPRN